MHVPLESILLALAEFELCFFHQLFSLQNQILKNFGTRTLLTAAPSGNKANKMAPRQKLSKYDFKIFSKLPMDRHKVALEAIEVAFKKLEGNYENINNAYIGEYKKFVFWVLKENKRPDPKNAPYRFITQATLEEYYQVEVPKRLMTTTNSCTRIRQALKHIFTCVETRQVENLPAQLLPDENVDDSIFENEAIKKGEQQQILNYKRRAEALHKADDPFAGLKADLLTTEEKKMVMTTILTTDGADGYDLGVSFNWGCNAGLRGATTRFTKISDLYVSTGFAPNQGRSLTIIIRKNGPKCNSFKADRLVGCLRHKFYLLCSVFSTAMKIVSTLVHDNESINFNRPNPKKEGASWWKIPFIAFGEYREEADAMEQVRTTK